MCALRVVLVSTLLALTCCTLAAHDHACYPFVAHQLRGHVPESLLRTLARERGTRKQVGRYRAPVGYYLRPRRAPPAVDTWTVVDKYELARCPVGDATVALPSTP